MDRLATKLRFTARYLKKHWVFTVLNILGLTLGLACSLIIGLFVFDKLNSDSSLEGREWIFRLEMSKVENSPTRNPFIHGVISQVITKDVAGVDLAIRMQMGSRTLKKSKESTHEMWKETVLFSDPGFFEVFNYQIIDGEGDLRQPNAAVITESVAKKYFGEESAVGREIMTSGENAKPLLITGVMQDLPGNSTLQFGLVASGNGVLKSNKSISFEDRYWMPYPTYLRIEGGKSLTDLEERIQISLTKYTDKSEIVAQHYRLVPFEEVKYDLKSFDQVIMPVDRQGLLIFLFIALSILALAVINYVNISTAQAMQRTREIGLKKIVGASKGQIVGQFFAESMIVCLGALLISMLLLDACIPLVESILENPLHYSYKSDWGFWLALILLILVLVLLTGVYPALVLSRLDYAAFLKGDVEKTSGWNTLRRCMVVFQFSISILLIIGAKQVGNQLEFIQRQTMDLDPEGVITIDGRFAKQYATLKRELGTVPGVSEVSFASTVPGDNSAFRIRKKQVPFSYLVLTVDEDYFKVMNVDFLEGKGFDANNTAQLKEGIILNESMARALQSADISYNQKVSFHGRSPNRVLGVSEDFHIFSLAKEVEPTVFIHASKADFNLSRAVIRLNTTDLKSSIEGISAVWRNLYPDQLFEFEFLDKRIEKFYTAERRIAEMFNVFTFLAIIISCLGLFGLSAFNVKVREKEMSVRKVLGADVIQIAWLLMSRVFLLIAIAGLVAVPLAYYFSDLWLRKFVYKVSLDLDTVTISVLAGFILAGFTVALQIYRLAVSNPIRYLREG